MTTHDKEILINAPVEKIFTFLINPGNLLQIWPSLTEATNEKLLSNGGYRSNWKYKMCGMHFHGTGEVTDIDPNSWFTFKTHGAVDSTITWTFRVKDGQTRVTLTAEYRVPLTLVGRLTEAIITKMNDKEADLILHNLQARFEAS